MSMLVVGAKAPAFSLVSLDGRTVSLADFQGRRLLLAFLRNAKCAVCNLWVHDTARRAAEWRSHGLDVLAVFEARRDRLQAQFADMPPPFSVLADPDGAVHDDYGSRNDPARIDHVVSSGSAGETIARAAAAGFPLIKEVDSNFARLPAEVLIDESGCVARIHVAASIVDHLPAAEIDAFARRG
jgi:thioredoxin-dependent peroxiredoxin